SCFLFFFLLPLRLPISTLFPYTTLFRSLSDILRSWSLPIILLLLVILFPIGLLKIPIIQKANAAVATISLVGYASTGWVGTDGTVNPTITMPHGELLNMTTSSGDGKLHQFYVDVDGNGIRDYP